MTAECKVEQLPAQWTVRHYKLGLGHIVPALYGQTTTMAMLDTNLLPLTKVPLEPLASR